MAKIKIQADLTAWIRNDGYNYPETNPLTATGKSVSGEFIWEYNSYYIFNIPADIPSVVSAELHYDLVHYSSSDDSESISIYDVSTPIAELSHNHTNSDYGLNPSIYLDMQSGNQLATGAVFGTEIGNDIGFSLNSTAIDAINSASGSELVFGMTATDIAGSYSQIFGFNSSGIRGYQELWITTIPLPSSIIVFTSGIIVLAAYLKRHR
jgi:hypothetical protein